MNFAVAIFIYIIVFILLIWATIRLKTTMLSGITLSALLSALLLSLLVPFKEIDQHIDTMVDGVPRKEALDAATWIIILIYIFTLILITWYVIAKTYSEVKYVESLECNNDEGNDNGGNEGGSGNGVNEGGNNVPSN